jgi:hypothetical protein
MGVSIKNTLSLLKTSSLLRNSFGAKGIEACFRAIRHFMQKHNYVYCQRTNKATRAAQEVYDKAQEFMELTPPLLLDPHWDWRWIFNMDQTPLHFSYHSSKTYVKCGTKTIHVRKMPNGTKRATGALTVTAAGNFLMPMIIFKGKLNGKIAKTEFKKIDPTSVYACQDAAWMDKRCMLMWVEQIFALYLLANPPPPCIQLVILLDAY